MDEERFNQLINEGQIIHYLPVEEDSQEKSSEMSDCEEYNDYKQRGNSPTNGHTPYFTEVHEGLASMNKLLAQAPQPPLPYMELNDSTKQCTINNKTGHETTSFYSKNLINAKHAVKMIPS